ncbi:MAG: hypothetical protein ACXWWC_13635 [Chitinophagaceae bacterium]
MKKRLIPFAFFACLIILITSFRRHSSFSSTSITGAWHLQQTNTEQVLIFQDGYFSHTVFDKVNKKFISTYGGIYKTDGKTLKLLLEFDTRSMDDIGKEKNISHTVADKMLHIDISGSHQHWTRIDEGADKLAGVWRITGRMVDGKINPMQRGDRKTLKLLSGTRFQWMAINPATKEFFGTGGGTYTFTNGKYTEHIEYFSRDSTRVGASLSFDGTIKDGVWNHSGKSSKGDPINELWSKESY